MSVLVIISACFLSFLVGYALSAWISYCDEINALDDLEDYSEHIAELEAQVLALCEVLNKSERNDQRDANGRFTKRAVN